MGRVLTKQPSSLSETEVRKSVASFDNVGSHVLFLSHSHNMADPYVPLQSPSVELSPRLKVAKPVALSV